MNEASLKAECNDEFSNRLADEEAKQYFRFHRLYYSDGLWYFSTREAHDMGPYQFRLEAEKALSEYIFTSRFFPKG